MNLICCGCCFLVLCLSYFVIPAYCVALDMTARGLQTKAKQKGLPWTIAKGYDTFCPLSPPLPKQAIPDPQNVELWPQGKSMIHCCPLAPLMMTRFGSEAKRGETMLLWLFLLSLFTCLPDCIITFIFFSSIFVAPSLLVLLIFLFCPLFVLI